MMDARKQDRRMTVQLAFEADRKSASLLAKCYKHLLAPEDASNSVRDRDSGDSRSYVCVEAKS